MNKSIKVPAIAMQSKEKLELKKNMKIVLRDLKKRKIVFRALLFFLFDFD